MKFVWIKPSSGKYSELLLTKIFSLLFTYKLDGVGPVDNRPSTDQLHHFVEKKRRRKKEEKI